MEGDSRGHIEKLNTKASNMEHDDSAIFQPTWFDIIQYWLVNLTGSLWRANFVMYFIAALFFGLAILLRWQYSRKNNNI